MSEGRVLSELAISEWEEVAKDGGSCTSEGIEWFISTIRDRDRVIAELTATLDEGAQWRSRKLWQESCEHAEAEADALRKENERLLESNHRLVLELQRQTEALAKIGGTQDE